MINVLNLTKTQFFICQQSQLLSLFSWRKSLRPMYQLPYITQYNNNLLHLISKDRPIKVQ